MLRPAWRQATRLAAHGIMRPSKTFGGETVVASTCLYMSCLFLSRAHGVVVSHPLRMRKALGSIPSVSIQLLEFAQIHLSTDHRPDVLVVLLLFIKHFHEHCCLLLRRRPWDRHCTIVAHRNMIHPQRPPRPPREHGGRGKVSSLGGPARRTRRDHK